MECLYCDKPFEKNSRSNKKFCNHFCKTAFHNDVSKEENDEIKEIKNTLKRNWKILKELLGDEKYRIVDKPTLIEEGFKLDYHTHHYTNPKGVEYIYCYNYGLREGHGLHEYMIVKGIERLFPK